MPRILAFLVLAVLFGCGNRGGTTAESTAAPGSVQVVIDTATGRDCVVQFEVGAASLEAPDGTTTGNLLARSQRVTFTDPNGDLTGFSLRRVPSGTWNLLHLLLVPGTGTVQLPDGAVRALQAAPELVIPIADGLLHASDRTSWVALAHDVPDTVFTTPAGMLWQPSITGRIDGSEHEVADLQPMHVADGEVIAAWPALGGAPLRVEFAAECAFADREEPQVVSQPQFLARLDVNDELRVHGELRRDGRFVATRAHSSRRHDVPRVIGRIVELEPLNRTFVMRVLAETQRAHREPLTTERLVRVLTDNAEIHRPDTRVVLTFADLHVGNLVKVRSRSRSFVLNGEPVLDAYDIEVPAGDGVPLRPEWQGRVASVDLDLDRIVVEPRNGVPIVINGSVVAQATLVVDEYTVLQRREVQGPGRFPIELEGVVVGDRIQWRGTVLDPSTVRATWVRVRAE